MGQALWLSAMVGIARPRQTSGAAINDRLITLRAGLPAVPERLLPAHVRGEVLSRPANLPDFRGWCATSIKHWTLASIPCLRVYRDAQRADVKRFVTGDYDEVLGMLERRLDSRTRGDSRVCSEGASQSPSLVDAAGGPGGDHDDRDARYFDQKTHWCRSIRDTS